MAIRPFQHAAVSPALACAPGAAAALADQRPLKKLSKVAVLTDKGVSDAGVAAKVIEPLGDKVAFVDTDTVPDADTKHVDGLAERITREGVQAIVAVGGGSVLDTAKAVAACVAKDKKILELAGFATVRTALMPIVAVPTTAGTGAEATQFVVVKDRDAGTKVILADHSLVPSHAVLDPTLLTGLPRAVTAATGVDALTHAAEALVSKAGHPVGVAAALEAVHLIGPGGALARSLDNPEDVDARAEMLVAAHLAGQAISTNLLGACHAFAHALGALKGTPHGVANGLFLVDTIKLNMPKAKAKYARLGHALGGTGDEDALAAFALTETERLVHEVAGIPRTLREVGVEEGELERLCELVLLDHDLPTNPVRVDGPEPVMAVLKARL
jgi:alcohol dehydrogenase class IV